MACKGFKMVYEGQLIKSNFQGKMIIQDIKPRTEIDQIFYHLMAELNTTKPTKKIPFLRTPRCRQHRPVGR